MSRNYRIKACGLLVLMLGLSACTTPSSESASDIGQTNNDATAPTQIATPERPLDDFFNVIWGMGLSSEEQARQHEARNIERQELMAQCMREQGFEIISI